MTTGPGVTRLSGAGWGSRIHGARPLGAMVGVNPRIGTAAGVGVSAGVRAGASTGVGDSFGVLASVAPLPAAGVGVAAAIGVDVPTSAVSRVGVGRLVDNDDVASPNAANNAPTADQAKLPSSRMPTMPTMMAISRAGEPSSGRADRST